MKRRTYSLFLIVALLYSSQMRLMAQESSGGSSWENLTQQELTPAANGQSAQVSNQGAATAQAAQQNNQVADSTSTVVAESAAGQPNVDILDESLKFHSNMGNSGADMVPMSGAIAGSTGNHMAGSMYGGNNNLIMQQNMMQQNMMQQQSMMQQNMMPMMGSCMMNGQAVMYPANTPCTINVFQTPVQPQQPDLAQSLLGVDSKTVGVVGATALMGAFMQNGGVGGMLRSAGWDNHRHIRGQSIGGY
ncbi:MAG: hypothetical protein K2Z81_10530 [Cyanobacteria bacterium]|nr:hypothetical protein [Cyanobacteriota bacterium]